MGQPAARAPRPRASHEDVIAANGAIAVSWVMLARVNRIRTDPKFLFLWHLSNARGS